MSRLPQTTKPRALRALLVGVSFVALGLLAVGFFTPGGAGRFTTRYVGAGEVEGWLWRYWWLKQALAAIWSSPDLGLFERVRLSLQSSLYPEFGNITDLWAVSAPLEWLLGAPLYYNVKAVAVLAANAGAAYVMARGLGASPGAAWLAGVIFGFNPYFMFEITSGRMRQAIGFTCPLYVLWAWRAFASGQARDALVAALWWALTGWIFYFYGMWLAFFNVGLVAWWLAFGRRQPSPPGRWKHFALMHVVALLLVMPSVMPYFDSLKRGHDLHEVSYLSDVPPLEQWAELPPGRPGPGQEALYSMHRYTYMSQPADYLYDLEASRVVPLAFTLAALVPLLWLRTRDGDEAGATQWLWVMVGVGFYVVSLGPYLMAGGTRAHFVGYPPGIRLPYTLLYKYVPFFSRMYSPVRASIMVYLAVAALAALNLTRLSRKRAWVAPCLALVLAAAGLAQMHHAGAIPIRTVNLEAPTYYAALKMAPDDGIIEVPFHAGDYTDFLQTVHGRKVLMSWADAGLPDGFPDAPVQTLAARQPLGDNGFVRWLDALTQSPDEKKSYSDAERALVTAAGYRFIVLHERGVAMFCREGETSARYEQMRKTLVDALGAPVIEATEIEPTGPQTGEPLRLRVSVFRLP